MKVRVDASVRISILGALGWIRIPWSHDQTFGQIVGVADAT